MKHSSRELEPWEQLGSGIPAIMEEGEQAALSRSIAEKVAALQTMEQAILAPSTLHLFYDLYAYLATQHIALFFDENVYAVSRYGAEQAQVKSVPIHTFRHQDATDLVSTLQRHLRAQRIPVVVSDGWCPQCGKAAPLQQYAEILQDYNGWIVLDDTQAFGVLGNKATADMPYGKGGGGLLRRLRDSAVRSLSEQHCRVIAIVSMAKGFGVPLAALSSTRRFAEQFVRHSQTRVHSSPPSFAALHGARHALQRNEFEGDNMRERLYRNVCYFRHRVQAQGLYPDGSVFPVQTLSLEQSADVIRLQQFLSQRGIRSVAVAPHKNTSSGLCCILCAHHNKHDIDALADALIRFFHRQSRLSPMSRQSTSYHPQRYNHENIPR